MAFASPANDELIDTITIGEYLLRDKDSSYLLQMQGNAMEEYGIRAGDYIVFERTHVYKQGDLVVALGDDGYTVVYVNTHSTATDIVGIVTGTFRKYV